MTERVTFPSDVVGETRLIASDTPDVHLHLINRRRRDKSAFAAERTLVMVHGATFSSASLFDVPVGGVSFMDVVALAGYDVWAVDVRGYGGSTRPVEMLRPPQEGQPVAPARTAVRDLRAAVDFVRGHRGISRVNVLGMSWGATVAGAFASESGEKLEKLVLVTPLWLSDKPLRVDPGGALGAYRMVSPKGFEAAWRAAAPEGARRALIPEGWFEIWEQATLATDPQVTADGMIRAPTGAVRDVREHWTAGNPLYEPAAIVCPVLVIAAEWDIDVRIDMSHDLFVRLHRVPYKRFVEIGQATHMVLMEKNRRQAFDAVIAFLDERCASAS